jgi:hypothetical protein
VRGGCGVSALIVFGADEKPLLMAAVFFSLAVLFAGQSSRPWQWLQT